MEYWVKRNIKTQETLSNKSIKETEMQLKKYYQSSLKSVLKDFEDTYNKLLSTIDRNQEITVADLYRLDKYWQMQTDLTSKLQKLGDKQSALLSKRFVETYKAIYKGLELPSSKSFSMLDDTTAQQMINRIWCADGKSWSKRIWDNTERLQKALNDNLINCVVTGKNPSYLKELLQKEFGVSYRRADTLVRTEITHIQAEAARQRYMDAGVEEIEVFAAEDERTCKVCGKKHKTILPIGTTDLPPFHANCRCCVIPIIH